jgi:ribosomal protein S18 acetylase RimI-like enzyme
MLTRAARATDLEALIDLERAFPGDRLSRRAFRYHLVNPRAVFLVTEEGGAIAGYALMLRRKGSDWSRLYSLVRAATAVPGIGARLLEACIEEARALGCTGIRLEVRADNRSAIRLYERHGFSLVERIEGYYEDGAPALRMTRLLAD